jgi:hypothetical protein
MPGILRDWGGYIVYIGLWGKTSSNNRDIHVYWYKRFSKAFLG